jgi:hypothetical protein
MWHKAQLVRDADNLASVSVSNVQTIWFPQYLTTGQRIQITFKDVIKLQIFGRNFGQQSGTSVWIFH